MTFGDWVEIEKLTEDTGQAITYRVYKHDDDEGTPRVLKLMNGQGPFRNRRERFRSEIEACKRLLHPNIVTFIEEGTHNQKPFIVTEYCERGSLSFKALVGKTLIERLYLFRSICDGVAHAHNQGVVHRDLKPDNIFLKADYTPVVGDFGLCFFLDGSNERDTLVQEAVGARGYMAPEYEPGRVDRVTATADVYSLGKILYWMLSGRTFPQQAYSTAPYDLRPHQHTTDMMVVYSLFDRTVLFDPNARLKNGAELVDKLDEVIKLIVSRRRVYDLSNTPVCNVNHPEVVLTSFRPGSTVMREMLDTNGFQVMGFGGSDDNMALWAVDGSVGNPSELTVFTMSDHGPWRHLRYKSNGQIVLPQGEGYQAIAFDAQGQACVAIAEVQESAQTRMLMLTCDGDSTNLSTMSIPESSGRPRYFALAIGPRSEIAVYCGNLILGPSGMLSKTVVQVGPALDRHTHQPTTNLPAPLVFDDTGKLHQAVVSVGFDGLQGVRRLAYITREPDGHWAEVTLDSTNGREGLGPTVGGRMSGHISVCLAPDDSPAILANSSHCSQDNVIVYHCESGVWKHHEIELRSVADDYGLADIDAGAVKQLLFSIDPEDRRKRKRAHIAILHEQAPITGVLYVMLDDQWSVIDHRFFPAQQFFGMTARDDGKVTIALR